MYHKIKKLIIGACFIALPINAASVTITSPATGAIVSGVTLPIYGTASSNPNNVRLTLNTTIIGTTPVAVDNSWTFTTNDLGDGFYSITAQLMNTSFETLASDVNTFTVQNPQYITISSPQSGDTIIAASAFIQGQASLANTLVNVYLNSSLITTATTDDNGFWQAIFNPTENGSLTLTTSLIQSGSPVANAAVTVTAQAPFYFPSAGSIGAGMLSSDTLGVISTSTTTNYAVQVGNSVGTLSSLIVATNGQILIGSTNNNPIFASLTSTGSSVTFTPGAGSLNLESVPVFGKVVRVDTVFGNDSLGARNGPPFLTITAALAAAQSGDMVWIFPGTYAESFTIPTGVTVQGVSTGAVKITKAVATATDLVTMGETTRLSEVALTLTSTLHVQLRGVVFPGTTSKTAKLRTATVTVDNSTAGAGTSNVYGVHSTGSGEPAEEISAIRASTISVSSAGLGSKRGILVDADNHFHMRDTNITVTNSGGGSAIGVETNSASALFTARSSTIAGYGSLSADISQTLGAMTIVTTDLLNANANELGFTTAISPSVIVWADGGTLPGGTNFMHVGTDTPATEMFVRCATKLLVKSLSARQRTAPTGGNARNIWTLRQNGLDTIMTVTITGPATSALNNSQSVSFAEGDSISLKVVKDSTGGGSETTVVMELY